MEPVPAPQLGRFLFLIHLGGALLFLNSYFVGKVALELGPVPDVAFVFQFAGKSKSSRKGSPRELWSSRPVHSAQNCDDNCEQLCDDDVFLDRGQILDFSRKGSP